MIFSLCLSGTIFHQTNDARLPCISTIIFISGPCGSGKTTFADAYAKYLVELNHKTVYVIHGDDFHRGFVEPEEKGDFFVDGQASNQVLWEDILHFNWDCILATAQAIRIKYNGAGFIPIRELMAKQTA